MSNKSIQEQFCMYVNHMQDKERHTKQACQEADSFNQFCMDTFPDNSKLQSELYDRMMDVAVEFEESGFIAGFKTAFALLQDIGKECAA